MAGTIFLFDEGDVEVLKGTTTMKAPPIYYPGSLENTFIIVDMDDSDDSIERMFGPYAQKGTLLCPPPLALYKEIDGDSNGFMNDYMSYLYNDPSVYDYLAVVLSYWYRGGSVALFSPSKISSGSLWLKVLQDYFRCEFGFNIGTKTTAFTVNQAISPNVMRRLYYTGTISVFEFIMAMGSNPQNIACPGVVDYYSMVLNSLIPFCGPYDSPVNLLNYICYNNNTRPSKILRPAISFG